MGESTWSADNAIIAGVTTQEADSLRVKTATACGTRIFLPRLGPAEAYLCLREEGKTAMLPAQICTVLGGGTFHKARVTKAANRSGGKIIFLNEGSTKINGISGVSGGERLMQTMLFFTSHGGKFEHLRSEGGSVLYLAKRVIRGFDLLHRRQDVVVLVRHHEHNQHSVTLLTPQELLTPMICALWMALEGYPQCASFNGSTDPQEISALIVGAKLPKGPASR